MGFLFPFFLFAGVALLIPILIHLFNLRKYKHVFFPDVRFLKQLQARTRKSAKLQKKWLLLSRLLFLAALILAFSQPYLKSGEMPKSSQVVNLLYIDNSLSMSAQEGQESLFRKAKRSAITLIGNLPENERFVILNNDKMNAGRPVDARSAIDEIESLQLSSKIADAGQIIGSVETSSENEANVYWHVYLFSDFQESTFVTAPGGAGQLKNTDLYLVPFQMSSLSNLYIDTAYFSGQAGDADSRLVVALKKTGKAANISGSLRINVEGQTRAVAELADFKDVWSDTFNLNLSPGWQKVTLSVQDHPLRFDDTFRLTVQPLPSLSILVIGENEIDPYLQAALSSYQGFKPNWKRSSSVSDTAQWDSYSLIVLQNLNDLSPPLQKSIAAYLEKGGSVLFFPASAARPERLNHAFRNLTPVTFGNLDTSQQEVFRLQEHHPLFKDVFREVPENVQLPFVRGRFPLSADIMANQQSIMSFRDGSPFLAQYAVRKGKLFLSAAALDIRYSDLALSNFFVPLLYKMAVQNYSQSPPSVVAGSRQPVWLSTMQQQDRGVWHLQKEGFDAIPLQTPSGAGMNIFLGSVASEPGFYTLQQNGGADSMLIAVNTDRKESVIGPASRQLVESSFSPLKTQWLNEKEISRDGHSHRNNSFPLWKLCLIIALLCLCLETYFLWTGNVRVKDKQ